MSISEKVESCYQQSSDTHISAEIMYENAQQTTDFLKSLSHPARLMILCRLAEGAANVGELEKTLSLPQAAVSKQLTRLRNEGLVKCERDGRSIIYSIKDERARKIVDVLYQLFCEAQNTGKKLN